MILEVAILTVIPTQTEAFETAFQQAEPLIQVQKGYISHELQRCLEKNNQYILLVKWVTLEDHTKGFRRSTEYQDWKKLLHHFYDPFPTVEHYTLV